jgi:hypothetical protein
MLFLSGAFLLGVLSGNSLTLQDSLAQGYEGLIAGPVTGKDGKDQPLGYKGLIPGYVPGQENNPPSAQTRNENSPASVYPAPENRTPAPMSVAKGYVPPPKARTMADIKLLSMTAPDMIDWKTAQVPKEIEKTLASMLTPQDKKNLTAPRYRIAGMLPREYSAKMKVDTVMAFVNNPKISDRARRESAAQAREKLVGYANFLENQSHIPDTIYQKMGVPDVYLQETREGEQKAIDRVESALKELRKYQ